MKHFKALLVVLGSMIFLISCTRSGDESSSPVPVIQMPMPQPEVEISVFFTDMNRFATGMEPYEVEVRRSVPTMPADWPVETIDSYLPTQGIKAFFSGPLPEEADQGLQRVSSGFTSLRLLTISNEGIARIYLEGLCANNGAAYSVANLIFKNLEQFSGIKAIKIYDENDTTLIPEGMENSLPYCLEP